MTATTFKAHDVPDAVRGAVHKPCVFNPNGANKEMCTRLSGTPAHAVRCKESQCTSQWRVRNDQKPLSEREILAAELASRRALQPRTPVAAPVARPIQEPMVAKAPPQASQPRPEQVRAVPKPAPPQAPVVPKAQAPEPAPAPPVASPPAEPKQTTPKALTIPTHPDEESSEEGSSGWQEVLDRVKVAMANSTMVLLDPKQIRPMKGQPRAFFNEVSLAHLRTTIRQVGQIQAGIVRAVDDGESGVTHELLDGERRWRVVCLEEISFYRAQLVAIDDEAAPYMIAAIANFNREGHTPTEISDAIHKLRTGPIKVPMKAVAEIFGFTVLWTYQIHGLQNLHEDVRAMLDPNQPKEKLLPLTAAIQLSKLDPELQVDIAHKVISREVTLSRLRKEVMDAGEEHGAPVRTRSIKSSKVLESFANRTSKITRDAGDLLEKVNDLRERNVLPREGSSFGNSMLVSIRAAIRDLQQIEYHMVRKSE